MSQESPIRNDGGRTSGESSPQLLTIDNALKTFKICKKLREAKWSVREIFPRLVTRESGFPKGQTKEAENALMAVSVVCVKSDCSCLHHKEDCDQSLAHCNHTYAHLECFGILTTLIGSISALLIPRHVAIDQVLTAVGGMNGVDVLCMLACFVSLHC